MDNLSVQTKNLDTRQMNKQFSDHPFLAKWLNNELNESERLSFEQSEEFNKYNRIITAVDQLERPDFNKREILQEINEKIQTSSKTKVIKLIPNWFWGAAASILILLGVSYFMLDSTIQHSTGYGQELSLFLPDGSEVILNTKSNLSYEKDDWKNNRIVFLEGEAFFKVQKGSNFTVETNTGKVEVLGTQFTVNTYDNFFEVQCMEGKVRATNTHKMQVILNKGKAFRSIDQNTEQWEVSEHEPSWLSGETSFTNTPLITVIRSLEKRFNITFENSGVNLNQRFTGSYNNKNIELALKTIFVPMEISYTFKNENNIILVKE